MTTATKYKTYPKYKSSGIDWLGDIPDGWEMKKLKHAVKELVGGGTPDTGNDQNWTDDENGTPWVNIADMTNAFHIQETEKRVTTMGLAEKNLRILPKNTLLYSMYASLGKVALLDIEAVTNQAILGVVEDKHKAVSDFIKWWLISIESHLSLFSTSSTQNNLNEFKVKNMPLFLPSLPQQQSIADFLDRETTKIDEMVAKKKKLMELLKENRQALITHAVTKGLDSKAKMKTSDTDWLGDIPEGWKVKRLRFVLDLVGGNGFPEDLQGRLEGEYPFYKVSDINGENLFLETSNNYVDRADIVKNNWKIVPEGSIVTAKIGAALSLNHRKITKSDALIDNNMLGLSVKSDMFDSMYIFYMFKIIDLDWFVNPGAVPSVNIGQFIDTFLPIPEIKEQRTIADFLDRKTAKIDEMMKKVETQIEKLQEYRQALITSAVTGKIMVN
ncbi:MAG: restriction endonuclease subunit S [bacterium]|nr:restriction endonuclease subunit S [bacterium]